MKFLRLISLILVVGGVSASLAMAWDVTHEGHHVAHVGSPVRITLAFKTVPNENIESLKIFIDGILMKDAETAKAAASASRPGQGEITYIYHPDKRGQHRVELVPVIWGTDGQTHIRSSRVFLFLVL